MSDEIYGTDHILRLPSAPVYMSIMKTLEGKPIGNLLWLSFIHKEGLNLQNENVSSTLISLSKNIGDLTETKNEKGKVVRLTLDNKSYNIFLPHPESKFQISFVIVFEHKDTILVKDEHKEELVRKVMEKLKETKSFVNYINEEKDQIGRETKLYRKVQDVISQVIVKWDAKRVTYLKKKEAEERKRLAELAKKQLAEQAALAKDIEK